MPTESTADGSLMLRPALPHEAAVVRDLHVAARTAAGIPTPSTDEQVLAWIAGRLAGDDEVWLAEDDTGPVGYARWSDTWLDDLYVRPDRWRTGVGSALLDLVKSRLSTGFGLYAFVSNAAARAFYARHGLVEVTTHPGDRNPEQLPEVELAWLGADPKAGVRARIDDVDDRLADLLAERAALTALAQRVRRAQGEAAGPTARDREREAAIVARMAARAPSLDPAGLARVMHVVISESLRDDPVPPGAGEDVGAG